MSKVRRKEKRRNSPLGPGWAWAAWWAPSPLGVFFAWVVVGGGKRNRRRGGLMVREWATVICVMWIITFVYLMWLVPQVCEYDTVCFTYFSRKEIQLNLVPRNKESSTRKPLPWLMPSPPAPSPSSEKENPLSSSSFSSFEKVMSESFPAAKAAL